MIVFTKAIKVGLCDSNPEGAKVGVCGFSETVYIWDVRWQTMSFQTCRQRQRDKSLT